MYRIIEKAVQSGQANPVIEYLFSRQDSKDILKKISDDSNYLEVFQQSYSLYQKLSKELEKEKSIGELLTAYEVFLDKDFIIRTDSEAEQNFCKEYFEACVDVQKKVNNVIEAFLEKSLENKMKAYKDGYKDGFTNCYKVGFEDGHTKGYKVGYQDKEKGCMPRFVENPLDPSNDPLPPPLADIFKKPLSLLFSEPNNAAEMAENEKNKTD